jgi:hypothetical protein
LKKFSENCSADATLVLMTYDLRKFLLDAHNKYRNRVAGGRVPGYTAARRMPALVTEKKL